MTIHISATLAALTASVALALPAHAGDAWTGAYVGASLGAGHLSTDQYSPGQTVNDSYYGGYQVDPYGGFHTYGGLQAGLDWQLGTAVLGVRAQLLGTASPGDSLTKAEEIVTANAVALTTLSARAGHLLQPDLLGYVNAGVVAAHFNYSSVDERWDQVDDSLDAIRTGWTIGAGLEYRLTESISVFAEYNHVQFHTATSTFDYGTSGYIPHWTYEYTHALGTVQAGLNFRF